MSYQHTETMHIVMTPDSDSEQGFTISLVTDCYRYYINSDQIIIGTHDILSTLDMPTNEELVLKAIETLRTKQGEINARAYQETQELEAKINEYLLLTHEVS